MLKSSKKIIYYHTLTGVLFGALFPITAILSEIYLMKLSFSIESIALIHNENLLLFMIDSAPIFLGVFAYITGLHHAKSIIAHNNLIIQREELISSKLELSKSKKAIETRNKILYNNSIVDPITKLKNEKLLIKENINREKLMICILNINHFREINTIFGYDAGNYVLFELANVLKECGFNCYKLDNDEFAILNDKTSCSSHLPIFSNYVFETIVDKSFNFEGHEIFITVSLGLACTEKAITSENDVIDLIHNASYALKNAKANHLIYTIYDENLAEHLKSTDNFNWKRKIINSLRNNEIIAFYQPIYNNLTNLPAKYESLMRIKEKDGHIISPNNFLKAAKKYRLYNYLTREIFLHALDKIKELNVEVSINISIDDIRDFETKKFILSRLKHFEYTDKIVFELLESEGINNYDEVNEFINEIKLYRCKVAIDDFGSGYSNFAHILNLNIDYLKLDASIIKNINSDKNAEHIARMIVDFAKTINVKTIAEFVHSEEVQNKVKELGIDYSQGYFLGRPEEDINS